MLKDGVWDDRRFLGGVLANKTMRRQCKRLKPTTTGYRARMNLEDDNHVDCNIRLVSTRNV